MAKARKILARRKAIDNIHTVTRTMEMVATARFKKAYDRCVAARAYIEGCGELVDDLLASDKRGLLSHPLLRLPRKARTAPVRTVVVLASDRGLCGGYNGQIAGLASRHLGELAEAGREARLVVAGKRIVAPLKRDGHAIAQTLPTLDDAEGGWHVTARLADAMMDDLLDGEINGCDVIYGHLLGAGRYEPSTHSLLPLIVEPNGDQARADEQADAQREEEDRWGTPEPFEPPAPPEPLDPKPLDVRYDFLPDTKTLLERLLPTTVRLRLFQCFMEAAATEQIARMTSMRSASESAEEMIEDLNIKYNRTRQAQITTELAEILGGAEGVGQ